MMTETTDSCVVCGEFTGDFEELVKHHTEEHPKERFDPLWYSDESDWSKVEMSELPGAAREMLAQDDCDSEVDSCVRADLSKKELLGLCEQLLTRWEADLDEYAKSEGGYGVSVGVNACRLELRYALENGELPPLSEDVQNEVQTHDQ